MRWRELVLGMAGRRTNLALLFLVLGAVATGALNYATGTSWVRWVTIAHGAIALGIVVVSGWKWAIIRTGMASRRPSSTWPSVLLGVTVVVAVITGVLHASGLVLTYGPLDDMQLHVGAGLGTLPLLAWHVAARDERPRRRDLTRRNLVRSSLLLGAGLSVWTALEGVWVAAGTRGAHRRATGSFEDGSHDPAEMPSIIWLFDPRPVLDEQTWQLTIADASGTRALGYQQIAGFDDEITATIDCTSGWYAEQDWSGILLSRLVTPADEDRSVLVRSVTGYDRRFPLADLDRLWLATRYGGHPIAPRHGFPARLVAPGRRGYWWVKWVEHIETSETPWWAQPPYPLQ